MISSSLRSGAVILMARAASRDFPWSDHRMAAHPSGLMTE